MFHGLDRVNRRRLARLKQRGVAYTLNERFMLSELIRISNVIWRCLVYGCLSGFFALSIYIIGTLYANIETVSLFTT